jgi:hypothetical protein
MKIWNTVEDVLADFEADRPKPPPKSAAKAQERFAASNQPTVAVIDAATRGNDALTERLETMEDRRAKQAAKEYAEHAAQSTIWKALVHWRQSVERAQERVRSLDGEVPEKGVYDPIRRFEREMRGE